MDDRAALAHTANGIHNSIAMLVRCLVKNGALGDGQFEAELRATLEYPGAERSRLDYQQFEHLLEILEGRIPKPN